MTTGQREVFQPRGVPPFDGVRVVEVATGVAGPYVGKLLGDYGDDVHEEQCLVDPHLRARSFFRPNGSADVPLVDFPGHLWRWDGPAMVWGPTSRLGVDNEDVFRRVAGFNDAELAALQQQGHWSLDYLQPDGTPY